MRNIILRRVIIIIIALSLVLSVVFFAGGCGLNINRAGRDLNTYNMQLEFNAIDNIVSGKMQVDFKNKTEKALENLHFNLYPSAFRDGAEQKVVSEVNYEKCYYNGKSYGGIEILDCYENKNAGLEFSINGEDENILIVNLKQPVEPENTIRVCVDFIVTIPNANHRFGYGENTVNLGNFFPILCVYENGDWQDMFYYINGDPFYSQTANFNVDITYPAGFVLATTGEEVSTKANPPAPNANFITSTLKARAVRDFAIVLSEKFEVLENKVKGITVKYYHYGDTKADETLEACVNAMETYNKHFGEYPYKEIKIVMANFVHGGMEYPNLVMVADNIENYETYIYCIAHELAHQWWYGVVGNNQTEFAWLDEGLTEFSTAFFFEKNPQYGLSMEDLTERANSSYEVFQAVYGNVLNNINTAINRPIYDFATEPEYFYMAYVKGFLLFQTLSEMIGEKMMLKCLQNYYQDFAFKIATPDGIIGSFEKTSKSALEGFFNSFLNGKIITFSAEH